MRIRVATEADLPALERLWRDFEAELPAPVWVDLDHDEERREIAEIVAGEIALIAEGDDGEPVGFALARRAGSRLGRLTDLYVTPEARRGGVATALVQDVTSRLRELGLDFVRLEVMASNGDARAVYTRWGFREEDLTMVAPIETLAQRLAPAADGVSVGVVYVQTDDHAAVERAVSAFGPESARVRVRSTSRPAAGSRCATPSLRVIRRRFVVSPRSSPTVSAQSFSSSGWSRARSCGSWHVSEGA